jgi:hypothetical protein
MIRRIAQGIALLSPKIFQSATVETLNISLPRMVSRQLSCSQKTTPEARTTAENSSLPPQTLLQVRKRHPEKIPRVPFFTNTFPDRLPKYF